MVAVRISPSVKAHLIGWAKDALDFLGSTTKTSLGWLIPMLLTAGATAYLSFFYNQRANTQLVMQQQKMADLQQFRVSGAQLDQALGRMSDALVDDSGIQAARSEMRSAIGRNLADADSVALLLGPRTHDYIAGLANLRVTLDNVHDRSSGARLWQDSLGMMEARKRLLKDADRRAVVS